jgi:hypothetical protein
MNHHRLSAKDENPLPARARRRDLVPATPFDRVGQVWNSGDGGGEITEVKLCKTQHLKTLGAPSLSKLFYSAANRCPSYRNVNE